MTRNMRTGSTDSSDCSSLDEDPCLVSVQLLAGCGPDSAVRNSYQSMVNMLDKDLQVICVSEKSDFPDFPEYPTKGSPKVVVPCLATVLFFNSNQGCGKFAKNGKRHPFDKPDLLLNHIWDRHLDLEREFKHSLHLDDSDVTDGLKVIGHQRARKRDRALPFLRYDAILKESEENERNAEATELMENGQEMETIDIERAERMLDAKKQLETWPWEFHHTADTTKGISQCHGNAQDFFAYQPNRDVTRLYGDVIDTTKITRKKRLPRGKLGNTFVSLLQNAKVELEDGSRGRGDKPVLATDFPLMAVREVHYGRQKLRYTLFVDADNWTDQVEFYRLLLRRHEVTLRDDFCFFTIFYGENTDIQFALKKLGPGQRPVSLRSTILQFKVHKVGHLVPLLPHPCRSVSDSRWWTKDHDGNTVLLQICPNGNASVTSSSRCESDFTSPGGALTSTLETTDGTEDEFSLERLDSFVEPELPARMPLFQHSLYSNLNGRPRFGSRQTSSSLSPGSSSSTSPERRPRRFGGQKSLSCSLMDLGSASIFPIQRSSTTGSWASSRISESSDEPENTNFYRRAKMNKDTRRKSAGSMGNSPIPKPRSKSTCRTEKYKHNNTTRRKSHVDEEIEVYV